MKGTSKMSNRKGGKAWRCKRNLTYPKGEGWKTIPSFPDYMVNKEGQVWDLRTGKHRKVSKTPRSDGNYLSVILINDTGSHTRSLACLLDEAFQEKVWLSPYPEHYNITNRSKVRVHTPNAPVEYKVVKTVTETISVYPDIKVPCCICIHKEYKPECKVRIYVPAKRRMSFLEALKRLVVFR